MSESEFLALSEKLDRGLKLAYENMLRRKTLLGQNVVIADDDGNPFIVPAKECLEKYLAEKETAKD